MHKQLIGWLKNHAGVIETWMILTQFVVEPIDLLKMRGVVRPELARLVREFEGTDESD